MKRLFLFLIVCTLIPTASRSQQSMTIMFYNSENLFDPDDDPLKDDDAFTPQGDYHWTRSRYWDKLDAVSKVIVAADDDQAGSDDRNGSEGHEPVRFNAAETLADQIKSFTQAHKRNTLPRRH